jgi:hypothetical protein
VPTLPRSPRNPEDLDTQAEDHAADEWRYAMMHCYKPYAAPPEVAYEGTAQQALDTLAAGRRKKGRYDTA